MPWNNNPGGGGWKGGGGGPWGSGPQQRGPQPPDLEELLKRSQDRLRNVLPGGGRSNAAIGVLAAVALLALWLFNSIYTVQPDELGQELVFGDPKEEVAGPGLHFHWWPFETVEKVTVRQQREFIGTANDRRSSEEANLMLSGDQNIVEVDFSVIWRVADPKQFLFNVAEPEAFVRRVAESAMREFIGRSDAEEVRTEGRAAVEEAVRGILQSTLDSYGAGIGVIGIQLEQADPPAEVADAFEEVQRAQQDQARFQQEAAQYANRRLGEARGQAAEIRETAQGYKEQVIAEAQGESQRFTSVLAEYSEAKDVTRRRLFLETMETVLGDSNKVILEGGEGGSSVVPYLPLPELQRGQRQEQGARSTTQQATQGGTPAPSQQQETSQ